jgi:hypothetical protein
MMMLGDNDKQRQTEFYSYGKKICNILKLIVHTWSISEVMEAWKEVPHRLPRQEVLA